MDLDRATQAFLNRFPDTIRSEAERLRRAGAVKQIFGGPAFVQARIEDGADVYRVTLRRDRNNGWESQLRGPEADNPAVLCAAMLERIERGDALPDSPNEIDNLSLTAVVEEKLGRELNPEEDKFVEKLERRYKKYTLEDTLLDTDLVRLNAKWPVDSYDPITIWPTPPGNIIEFWNYIASAFEKKRLAWPAFMDAITDRESTKEKLIEWEEERETEVWKSRIDQVLTAREDIHTESLELRLRVTTREARLQSRIGFHGRANGAKAPAAFENVATDLEAQRIRAGLEEGTLQLDETSHLLWTIWSGFWPEDEPPSASVRLEGAPAAALLGKLFRQVTLADRIVTLDDLPFHRATDPLRWVCLDGANSEVATESLDDSDIPETFSLELEPETSAATETEAEQPARPSPPPAVSDGYQLRLLMPDGDPVPYNLTALPGAETLYISDDAVFRGPRTWTEGTDVPPRIEIPRRILESEAGLAFLHRLGAPPPPALQALAVNLPLQPSMSFKLVKRGATAESEFVQAEVTAADPDRLRVETYEKDQWKATIREPLPDGKLPVIERGRLYPIPKQLDELSFAWDSPQRCFRVKLTKTLPEKFSRWIESLPPDTAIELDGDLRSLRADPVQATVRFELAESEEIDWFDLKVLVDVEGLDLTRQQVRDLVEARGGFVRMSDGKWLRLSLALNEQQEAAIARLGLDVFDLSGETHRMHALQLADPGAKEVFDERAWERICSRAESLKLQVRPNVPPELALTLRPYQIEGFHFLAYLATNRFGGLLADDMGLGKTAQSLCWLLWLRGRAAEKPNEPIPVTLVVAPKSVLDVWASECKKFAPHLRVQVIRNKEELDTSKLSTEIDVLVMNYSQLRVNIDKIKPISWLAIILDEGQQIKNPDSMAARAARELHAGHRLVLSGTPIENRLLDVWSLMAFAMPGVLGNRKYFRDRFDRRKDPEAQIRLSARLRPFILRRTKGQVALDLPPRTEEEVYSKMEDVQEEMYQAELARMQRVLLGFENDAALRKNSFAVLQGLMRLRQICCHPGLLDPKADDSTSAKMTALWYLLDQLKEEGHKVLVFSQFVTMLEIIRKRLEEEDRPYVILTGQSKDRGAIVEKFQTSKDPTVFLLSLKAGGSGLNLTAASYVVLYDPWWNPAVENQAIDRTHRIGQTNPVIAYRLLMRNSVEEKIRRLQMQKQLLFTGVLGEESFASNLNLSDVKYLFSRED